MGNNNAKLDSSDNKKKKEKNDDTPQDIEIDLDSLPEYTMEEVSKHESKPNGGAGFLLEVAGEDATQEFEAAIHSDSARIKAKGLVIGKLKIDKTKKQVLSFPTSLNPQNNTQKKPPSKYPPSSNQNKSNTSNHSSAQSKPKQIKFTNMSHDHDTLKTQDILLLYGTQKGTSKHYAEILYNKLISQHKSKTIEIKNMNNFDAEDLEKESIVICMASTYENGQPAVDAKYFMHWICDAPSDCRIHDSFLSKVRIAVFGFGNSLYDEHYNTVAKTLYNNLLLLGGMPLLALGLADANVSRNDNGDINHDFNQWMSKLLPHINKALRDDKYPKNISTKKRKPIFKNGVDKITIASENKNENEIEIEHKLSDMEDIGRLMSENKNNMTIIPETENKSECKKEMVNSGIRKSLTKQGYKVIGSHSGVKLCRWTKSMLRGRGGCYKNTFYGIKSYQCLEMTPSLACANKCVFCWRHHTNPIGKEWKWVTDPPQFIFDKAIQHHKQMIKQMRGVPGVIKERLDEAMSQIRHCALSLVGEPIMYPYIDEYLQMLHDEKISSFLVSNAQFPEKIKSVSYVTQLYVSVDAATKESLKQIDRPLFKDYWQRMLLSLDYLRDKKQRTVYRLTLVKSWNISEIADYARLIARGLPTFIEVKGVTFCGKSDGSNLTMENIPFHFEVLRFCEKLCEYLSTDYEIACEHCHSCCVLIAKKELKIDGIWHTHIDYDRFFQLLQSGNEFSYMDYMAQTPHWAVVGAKEKGFNPNETKFVKQRNKNRKEKNEILQAKINKAMQDIENEKKKCEKILPKNNPYLMAKDKESCNDCNCKND